MSPQGSRAGLITAVVVLSILFVTSAIFAFYYNAEFRNSVNDNKNLNDTIARVAPNDYQQDPEFQTVDAMRTSDPTYQGQSVAQILIAQRNAAYNRLAKANSADAADKAYLQAIANATQEEVAGAGVTVTRGASLAEATNALAEGVKRLAAENATLSEQLASTQKQLEGEVEQRKVVLAERDQKVAEQGKQLEDALAELASRGEAGDQSVAKVQQEADRAAKLWQQTQAKLQKDIATKDASILALQKDLEAIQIKRREQRPVGSKENIVRQADGQIVRVPGRDTVFINLGKGDQISPGMTFEVYDRFAGVPAIGPDGTSEEGEMPQGKAAIEVTRVNPGQSECRIIRVTPGQSVIERDVIANLVYDKNSKYNFVVFGDFDLDQNDLATPGDADVIKRLITQWGGRLQDKVNVNTDFVVLGVEPEVPAEDDNPTATDIQRRQQAEQALESYLEVRSAAIRLNIPVMNQNRFLYYVGYFEEAQR